MVHRPFLVTVALEVVERPDLAVAWLRLGLSTGLAKLWLGTLVALVIFLVPVLWLAHAHCCVACYQEVVLVLVASLSLTLRVFVIDCVKLPADWFA